MKYLLTFRSDPEGRGCDQGHANYLVYNSKLNDFYLYSNNKGPVATALYLKNILFNKRSFLINEEEKIILLYINMINVGKNLKIKWKILNKI